MSISLHSGTNHARRRYFDSNKLDGTIPAALSALNLLSFLCAHPARDAAPCASVRPPARWCPQAPLRAPARTVALPCAYPRRTWPRVRWQPPPGSGPAPWGTRYRSQYPLACSCSARPRCECRARPVPLPRADRSTNMPMSTPRVPSEYPASSGEDGRRSDYRSSTVSEAPAAARARTTPERPRVPYARGSPPSTLRARCERV